MTNGSSASGRPDAARLHAKTINKAVKALSWEKLKAHLETVEFNDEAVDQLCGLILRTDSLVFNYPAPQKEDQRAAFFDALERYLERKIGISKEKKVHTELSAIATAERGYRGILENARP